MSADQASRRAHVSELIARASSALRVDRIRHTPLGERAFSSAYWVYKSKIEARDARGFSRLIAPGATVIDVGANLGFFSRLFVQAGANVIAVEPEHRNAEALRSGSRRWGGGRVTIIEAAVSDADGIVHLAVDPHNHADHQLAAEGVAIPAITLDSLIEAQGIPRVDAVKIDVQGAEELVLRGAHAMLSRDHPMIFIELDAPRLERQGSSAAAVLALIASHGYGLELITSRVPRPTTAARVLALVDEGAYVDVLCRVA